MAFIKIRLTAELEALRARAPKLDSIASPFLIHRKPERRQRRWPFTLKDCSDKTRKIALAFRIAYLYDIQHDKELQA